MKRYALFAWSHYYPAGGWRDFDSYHDCIADAQAEIVRRVNQYRRTEADWDCTDDSIPDVDDQYQIVDLQTGEVSLTIAKAYDKDEGAVWRVEA